MLSFTALKKAISSVGDEAEQLRSRIETAKRSREELVSAPFCRDDLADALCSCVDAQASSWPSDLQGAAAVFLRNPFKDPKATANVNVLASNPAGFSTGVRESA